MAFLLFYVLHASAEATLLTREGVGILLFVILYTALATAERNLRKHPISPAKPTYEVLEEGMVHA
jgi:hypothetical protein